jgi:archaeal cell division control protein 6
MNVKISNFFENFLNKDSIFSDKKVLLSSYLPNNVLYRDDLIQNIANILAPSLRLERPSNLFLYGKTGTGKTLSIRYVLNYMEETALKNKINLKVIYINCKLKRVADTEYRLIARLIKELGQEVPPTGLPTDEVYNKFYELVDKDEKIILIVLDEIDQLNKKMDDGIFYNLTRINAELKKSQIAIIGISNDLRFSENLDPRVKSSLSEEELLFPPYNALQIQKILKERTDLAFKKESLEMGVIEKCSAYAAREHGDARRAIDLIRVAGELAERSGSQILKIKHLDDAERKVESDRVINTVNNQPKQFQLVLFSIFLISTKERIHTGNIYDVYSNLCKKIKLNVLTQRRVSDILAEMDMLGIINAKIISKGRYGRTREINLAVNEDIEIKLKEVLEKSLNISLK